MRQKKSKKTSFTPHNASDGSKSSFRPRNNARGKKALTQEDKAQNAPHSDAMKAAKKGLVLYGQHAVLAALANPSRKIRRIFAQQRQAEKLAHLAQQLPCPIHPCHLELLNNIEIVEKEPLNKLCASGASAEPVHQGLAIHADPLEEMFLSDILHHLDDDTHKSVRLMVLDQVTDPRNIGAILRSAQAFGTSAILMTRKHAPAETAILAKTAAGALETVPIIRETNLARALDSLKAAGFTLAGLDASGDYDLEQLAPIAHLALIMGAEAGGMRRLTAEACDRIVSIPMQSEAESLNVSVAAAIALYATRPQTSR